MNDKIKILWVVNSFSYGGAERQTLYMYRILQQYCNFDITVLYYAKKGDDLCIDGVNAVYVDKAKIGTFNTVKEIAKYIRKHDFDIMHAFAGGTANSYGRAAALFSRKTIPVGAMLGKRHFASKPFRLSNIFLNLFGNWWTVNNPDLIPILRKDLHNVPLERIRVLHNGFVPADKIDYRLNEQTEFDLDKQDNFVFTVLGRLAPVKNYDLFIKAAAQLAQKHDNVRFWIIGSGVEEAHLKELAQECNVADKVRFWGYRTDTDVALSRTDVFVQTSFTEGSPNTVAEAMRARRPIVTTRSTDFSEMVRQGENGYVVESDNLSQLVDAMEQMLARTPDQRRQAGEVSYELFEAHFLDARVAAEIEKFYYEILGK